MLSLTHTIFAPQDRQVKVVLSATCGLCVLKKGFGGGPGGPRGFPPRPPMMGQGGPPPQGGYDR
jgi:hypothetical protein